MFQRTSHRFLLIAPAERVVEEVEGCKLVFFTRPGLSYAVAIVALCSGMRDFTQVRLMLCFQF